ncbi:MAG: HAD hydrolase-like protein [Acidobacteria bacterium]|nr:HAD hydrolase-like protein [Acidobacteriota bacterium]
MKKLIIFDLDGTLVDSLPDIAASLNDTAVKLGFPPFSADDVRGFVGDGVRVLIERAFPSEEGIREKALELFLNRYQAHLVDKTRPFPGISEVLVSLKEAGFQMGVLSNKLEKLSRQVVESFRELREPLSFVYGGDSFREKKPSFVPIREILKLQHTDSAVIIGDSPNDVRAGKGAGILTVAVSYGFMPVPVLMKENPDIMVDKPARLFDAVMSLMKTE